MRPRRNRAAVDESASVGIHGLVQGEDNVIELRVEHEDPVISPSFDALFLDLHDRLYRALYFVTGSSEDGEELMQEAFLKLWEPCILFNRVPDRNDVSNLWSVPVSGGHPTLVHRDAALGSFSPNGNRIAYVTVVGDLEFGSLWLARADGSGAQRLVRGHVEMPRWSPDGSKIAYVDSRGNGAIYVIDVSSGETTKAADLGAWPDWVNDHTLIYLRD